MVTKSGKKKVAPRPASKVAVKRTSAAPAKELALSPEVRLARIGFAAYLLAERDGFPPGREAEYWLRAEAELDLPPEPKPGK